jgi:hypothetical protein
MNFLDNLWLNIEQTHPQNIKSVHTNYDQYNSSSPIPMKNSNYIPVKNILKNDYQFKSSSLIPLKNYNSFQVKHSVKNNKQNSSISNIKLNESVLYNEYDTYCDDCKCCHDKYSSFGATSDMQQTYLEYPYMCPRWVENYSIQYESSEIQIGDTVMCGHIKFVYGGQLKTS